jgi:periplasmic protein TonB
VYILSVQPYAACLRGRLTSNVRPQKPTLGTPMSPRPHHIRLLAALLATVGSGTQAQGVPPSSPGIALIRGYSCQIADYPAAARRSEAQGTVKLQFLVAEDGSLGEVRVIKSAGETREHKILDLVSKRQIESCKYEGASPKLEQRVHEVELKWFLR